MDEGHLSYWLALILSIGSLLFYLSGAVWLRLTTLTGRDFRFDFNLGIPKTGNDDRLFAIALVSAGTSLSTVFLFFLGGGHLFGPWLLLCPLFFGAGNSLMFIIYKRALSLGYFQSEFGKERRTGLIPFLVTRLTNSHSIGLLITLISVLNLVAILVLELVVGVDVLGYLSRKTFLPSVGSAFDFPIFCISILLLLGYVFVGGFRAVVASDVWQMKAMSWAIGLTLAALAVVLIRSGVRLDLARLDPIAKAPVMFGFLVNVSVANLFIPLSQESSWQRFRAFSESSALHLRRAMYLSVRNATLLWLGLIVMSFTIRLVVPSLGHKQLATMSGILETLRTIDDSMFAFFVFPIMTVAALSAMYSVSDTAVSAILYLLEYRQEYRSSSHNLPLRYYASMVGLFVVAIAAYGFVRIWFHPSILQLVFSVFSNLIVVTPTVLSIAFLKPAEGRDTSRRPYILCSLIFGLMAFWGCAITGLVVGPEFLWLNQLSIAAGLLAAIVPLLPLWLGKVRWSQDHARRQGYTDLSRAEVSSKPEP